MIVLIKSMKAFNRPIHQFLIKIVNKLSSEKILIKINFDKYQDILINIKILIFDKHKTLSKFISNINIFDKYQDIDKYNQN